MEWRPLDCRPSWKPASATVSGPSWLTRRLPDLDGTRIRFIGGRDKVLEVAHFRPVPQHDAVRLSGMQQPGGEFGAFGRINLVHAAVGVDEADRAARIDDQFG